METINLKEEVGCYHCGDYCNDIITSSGRNFCCIGCKTVFEILNENNLCRYYELESSPGITLKKLDSALKSRFSCLDDERLASQIVDFTSGPVSACTFTIPMIHCSSCIWLLENLHKLNPAVILSEVNFPEKKLSVKFDNTKTSLRGIVELLASVGYEPQLNLGDAESGIKYKSNRSLYYRIGVAGFCFGNIMLLSFPEYLSIETLEQNYRFLFGLLNIVLGTPVLLYSASGYIKSAYNGIKQKVINIDFPIIFGLIVLFIRSVYEILTGTGAGFIDSMTGLIFFLLLGRLFQGKTYDTLNFERDYKSYFPLSVTVKKSGGETIIPVSALKAGDRIIIRNNELVPADAILFNGSANIDYSFVTGESQPVEKVAGEIIYAGGRQLGSAVELEVIRTVSQSYLTSLWNKDTFIKKDEDRFNSLVNTAAKYFTVIILIIAAAAFIYWYPHSLRTAINAFTAVLIIACPCGIALTSPFALGNAVRILGRNKFYIKNASVVEKLSKIDTIVFDKTGTITRPNDSRIVFNGGNLSDFELRLVKSAARSSTHPLSSKIYSSIKKYELFPVESYKEYSGKGIEAKIGNNIIRLGSALFAADNNKILLCSEYRLKRIETKVFLSINGIIKGYFSVQNVYRKGFQRIISLLNKKYRMALLSGDNEGEKEILSDYFGSDTELKFRQSPHDKLEYIERLQKSGRKVLMLGDGLNDAGALKQSEVGAAVSEDVMSFLPACDAIVDAASFNKLAEMLAFSGIVKKIIITGFIISALYNAAGVMLAFQSEISPLLAAILMPASSITVVLFTVLATNFAAKRKGLL